MGLSSLRMVLLGSASVNQFVLAGDGNADAACAAPNHECVMQGQLRAWMMTMMKMMILGGLYPTTNSSFVCVCVPYEYQKLPVNAPFNPSNSPIHNCRDEAAYPAVPCSTRASYIRSYSQHSTQDHPRMHTATMCVPTQRCIQCCIFEV